MKIKVGFDISPAGYVGGVATYTKELATRLGREDSLEMRFLYMSLRQKLPIRLKNVKGVPIPAKLYEPLLNKWRVFEIEKLLGKIDIYHSSDWVQARSKARTVTTIHDVIPFKFPEWSKPSIVEVHKRRMNWVEKEVDLVICVSETTKKDLLEVTNIDSEKIRVIYEGVDDRFHVYPKDQIEKFRVKKKLPTSFVLAIGGIGERRNLDKVRKACEELGIDLLISGIDIRVSDVEMPLLYNASVALIYPSLYEGFGLPILEAFKCRIPVVTSDRGAMKEVAGNAAILVDPDKLSSIRDGIKDVLDSNKLKKNVAQGIIRASQFSWDKCSQQTVKVYQELMK